MEAGTHSHLHAGGHTKLCDVFCPEVRAGQKHKQRAAISRKKYVTQSRNHKETG